MKRFIVFAGDYYYPAGGWNDFREEFETSEEAEAYVEVEFESWNRKNKSSIGDGYWWQIVDVDSGKVVKENG